MQLQPIFDLVEICSQLGVSEAIVSPGSRSAPLTLAVARHPKINTRVIIDERSAAYIALGVAQQLKKPVILISTSGTAALNYAPGIAEAFYQQIPLIVFTADRPPEWIDQNDGQSIQQNFIYSNYVKNQVELPVNLDHPDEKWHAQRLVSESVNLAVRQPSGPVHINVPFREPFYPEEGENLNYNNIKIVAEPNHKVKLTDRSFKKIISDLVRFKRVLIVAGQGNYQPELRSVISGLSENSKIPVVCDVISNMHTVKQCVRHQDLILSDPTAQKNVDLLPELVITLGKALVSKNLKIFLRANDNLEHWHIHSGGHAPDVFKALGKNILCEPQEFFSELNRNLKTFKFPEQYINYWQTAEQTAIQKLVDFSSENDVFSELEAVATIFKKLPESGFLHLGNSMPVRYANIIGINNSKLEVNSNRGVSGIDGVLSTAAGNAMANSNLQIVLIGDLSFFYDRNAFWNKFISDNLRIIVLNNHGGGIFDVLEASSKLPEAKEFFITDQPLSAELVAQEYDFEYQSCNNNTDLLKRLETFFNKTGKSKILEIEIVMAKSSNIYKKLFKHS
jgi:2-succinyl-5-enolpyruvyl-6-hydroxy-3-cyclohexene-1-carboxylate synthase